MEKSTDIIKYKNENSTKTYKSNDTVDKRHELAMQLKYGGVPYKKIAEEIGLALQTVRMWFMIGGLLYTKYYDYASKMNDQMEKETRLMLRSKMFKAVNVLDRAMKDTIRVLSKCPQCKKKHVVVMDIPTMSKLRAAENILDRVMGKVTPDGINQFINVNINNSYEHLSNTELDRRIEELERGTVEEVRESPTS